MFNLSGRRSIAAFSAIAGAALMLSACSGGGSSASGDNVKVSAKKGAFAFEPAAITVPANKPIHVTFENPDTQEHDWQVRDAGVTADLHAQPSKNAEGTFTFPKAGTYVPVTDESLRALGYSPFEAPQAGQAVI